MSYPPEMDLLRNLNNLYDKFSDTNCLHVNIAINADSSVRISFIIFPSFYTDSSVYEQSNPIQNKILTQLQEKIEYGENQEELKMEQDANQNEDSSQNLYQLKEIQERRGERIMIYHVNIFNEIIKFSIPSVSMVLLFLDKDGYSDRYIVYYNIYHFPQFLLNYYTRNNNLHLLSLFERLTQIKIEKQELEYKDQLRIFNNIKDQEMKERNIIKEEFCPLSLNFYIIDIPLVIPSPKCISTSQLNFNSNPVCSICQYSISLDEQQQQSFSTLTPCSHSFFKECLASYLKFEITEGCVLGMKCPGRNSHSENLVCSTVILPDQIRAYVNLKNIEEEIQILAKYDRFCLMKQNDSSYRNCPDCNHLQIRKSKIKEKK